MNFVKKHISTIVMALVGIAAVLYMNNRGPSSEKIKAFSGDTNTIWVDVREKEEVAEGTLKSAFWIPLSVLQSDENSANERAAPRPAGTPISTISQPGFREFFAF